MKRMIYILAIAAFSIINFSNSSFAQNCEIPVSVMVIDSENLDMSSVSILKNRLSNVAANKGLVANLDYSQFFVGVKINMIDKQIVSGSPIQVVTNYGVNIYVADLYNQKIFSSVYLELKGVGHNELKSLNSAISRITPSNVKITNTIESGKSKIVEYYNNRYKDILAMADREAKLNNYVEAVALCSSIPVCTNGGKEATKKAVEYYDKYRDELNKYLFNEAKAVWVGSQTAEAAQCAAEMLAEIDPNSSSYNAAQSLLNEIKAQVRKDVDFKEKEKYNNQVDIEKLKIDAIKAVGVAYGNGQQPNTTNLGWIN